MKNKLSTGLKLALALLALVLAVALSTIMLRPDVKHEVAKLDLQQPDISKQPLHLRVVHAINPRFPAMSGNQIQIMLDHASVMVRQYLGVDVIFDFQGSITVEQLFKFLPENLMLERQSSILDPHHITKNDRMKMSMALGAQLADYQNDPQSLINYARPYLIPGASVNDLDTLNHALINTLVSRISFWYDEKASDGKPYIDSSPYNQWVWWDSLGYGELPYDVVITNQLVASLETYDVALHSSLRGGINGGTMSYSKQGRYGGYVFVSVFSMLNDSSMISRLRDDAHYSDVQTEQYAAATLVHELGHLLFHYGHPFDAAGCVMNPTPVLKYREWYEGLEPGACATSHPQMQPGAARITYNPAW